MADRLLRIVPLFLLAAASFTACNRIPDHAKYIPKDAIAVVGIDVKSLGKKIAWNVVTGSKLFKEIQKRIPEKNTKDAMDRIEKSGIDFSNTIYVYVKSDTRSGGSERITGLVPLSDAGEWEEYIKQIFPQAAISQHGDHKEASLGRDMYAGWNNKLLILINTLSVSEGSGSMNGAPGVNVSSNMAQTDLSSEIQDAFSVTKENSIISNQRFANLQLGDHDVTLWLNYDQLMTQYMSSNVAAKMGVSLSNVLWKDAAFTGGFDFRKGKITGDMKYFMSDEMKDIGAALGAENADKDMIGRLPSDNMDMLLSMHIPPKGIKALMDKAGLLGLANIGLSTQGLNADSLLDAFTGDMAFEMSGFSLRNESVTDTFMGQTVVHQNQKPSLNLCYVVKINERENFDKLFQLAGQMGLQSFGSGFVIPIDDKDSVYILKGGGYAVASNSLAEANGVLLGTNKSQKAEPAGTAALSNPWSLYIDVTQLMKNIDPAIVHSPQDSAMFAESKNLISNFVLAGGAFKNNAFEYHMDINFVNTEENSILELMDYGMRMNDAGNLASQ